jgi:hypothetical protein
MHNVFSTLSYNVRPQSRLNDAVISMLRTNKLKTTPSAGVWGGWALVWPILGWMFGRRFRQTAVVHKQRH